MQIAIQVARGVVHFFVTLCYYSGQIGMQILSLIATTNPTPVIHQIMGYVSLLLAQFNQFFAMLGDLLYKMVMETGQLGQFIKNTVVDICNFLNQVFLYVVKPLICVIKETIMVILNAFDILLGGISVVFGGLGDFRDSIQTIRADLGDRLRCDGDSPFQCNGLFDNDEDLPSSLPMPTRCWVGYQPAVGEQGGFGCSASDTCMDDDGSLRACAACSGDVDMDRFGCDSLTKLCRCHTFPVGQTQCSSHRECLLPTTECGFVDAYLKPSFGNVPCARCSETPQCLVTSSSTGVCICLLRPTPTQFCAATYHAQRVTPDPTQLCLVSIGLSISTSSTYSANWQDLASTPCAMLNGAQTWCLSVWVNSANSFMVVGLSLLSGRRLLSINDHFSNTSLWTRAQEPCRSLMQHRDQLSILERHAAGECERWRLIGERAILHFNLTADPIQFTSYLGMAESSGLSLQVLLFVFKHADWAQPLLVVARRMWHQAVPFLNASKRLFQRYSPGTSSASTLLDLLPWTNNPRVQTIRPNSTHSSRRLLNWKDNLQAVQTFSIDIANGNIANLAPNLAASWSTGPFSWPPDYNYHANQTCLAASIAYNITFLAMQSTVAFYTHAGPARPVIANTLAEALPHFPAWVDLHKLPSEPQIVSFFRAQLQALLGIDLAVIKQYASSTSSAPSQLSTDLLALIQCDFVAVQHCNKQRRSLWWGGIVVALGFVAISLLARFMGVPFVDYALVMTYVPFTLWYVFGYSMNCMPLVPTCLASELLDITQRLLPTSISWPVQLQQWPGCVDGVPSSLLPTSLIRPGTADCFIPCTSAPFSYLTWEDSVAWLSCELGFCSQGHVISDTWQPPVDSFVSTLSLPSWLRDFIRLDRLVDAMQRKLPFVDWQDMKDAQRICFAFTIFNLVPLLVVSVLLVAAALSVVALAVALAQLTLNCLLVVFVFSHSR